MSRIFRSSTQVNDKLVGSLDVNANSIKVPKGWTAQTGAMLLPDVVIGKVLGEGFQVRSIAPLMRTQWPPPILTGSPRLAHDTTTLSSRRCGIS